MIGTAAPIFGDQIANALRIKEATANKNLRNGIYGEARRYGQHLGLPPHVWEEFLEHGTERKSVRRKRGSGGRFVT